MINWLISWNTDFIVLQQKSARGEERGSHYRGDRNGTNLHPAVFSVRFPCTHQMVKWIIILSALLFHPLLSNALPGTLGCLGAEIKGTKVVDVD